MSNKDGIWSYLDYCDVDALLKQKEKSGETIAVVVPTLNEEHNVRTVLSHIKENLQEKAPLVDELIVLDGGSSDATCDIAREYTPLVYDAREGIGGDQWSNGKGLALWRAQFLAKSSIVTFVDADIENFDNRFVTAVVAPFLYDKKCGFSKSFYKRPIKQGGVKSASGGGRVTEILVRPFLSHYFPEATGFIQPLSGEYGFRRELMHELLFYTGYGVETSLVLDFVRKFGMGRVAQVDLGERIHRNRPLSDLGKMSYVIIQTLMEFADSKEVVRLSEWQSEGYVGLEDNGPVLHKGCTQEALPLGKTFL